MASESAGVGSALPDQTGYSGYFLTTDGVTATWEAVSDTGVTTMAAVGSTANANGASISGFTLTLQPASATLPGVVTAGTQSFGGAKTFASTIAASNFSGDSSGTNTGDITLSAFGSTPDAKGAILTAQALALQPADATHPGLLSVAAQAVAGAKTFSSCPIVDTADSNLLNLKASTVQKVFVDQYGQVAGGVGAFPYLVGNISGANAAVWLGIAYATCGSTNYALSTISNNTTINSGNPSATAVSFRVNNTEAGKINATQLDLTGLGTGGAILIKDTVGGTTRTLVVTAGALVIT